MLMKPSINLTGISLRKPILMFGAIFCMLTLFSACKKKALRPVEKKETEYNITAAVNATNIKTGSTATGTLTATYKKSTKKLAYNLRFSDIDPESINLHLGTATELGTLVANIKKDGAKYTSPSIGTVELNEAGEKALLEDKVYLNIVSTKFPAGEIRGQLLLKK
jgi:hypothetical protein